MQRRRFRHQHRLAAHRIPQRVAVVTQRPQAALFAVYHHINIHQFSSFMACALSKQQVQQAIEAGCRAQQHRPADVGIIDPLQDAHR